MRILIVDDEPDMVTSLARILRANGFDVEAARDGAEAVDKNLSWEPDAAIMDIRMPRMNGIDACLEFHRSRPEVMVILMTGFSEALDEANQNILAEARQKHRVELKFKPLDLDEIMRELKEGPEAPS